MTDRLIIDGWIVYLQERSNGAVATVRSDPWSYSQPEAPLASFGATSAPAALRHAERWIQQHSSPEGSRTNAPQGSESEPWRDPEARSPLADEHRRQVQIMEARQLLGAQGVSDRQSLRYRFLELAKLHHPDHGGNRDHWERLHGAYKFLDFYLTPQLPDSYDTQLKDGW